jgi:hypothetical protein
MLVYAVTILLVSVHTMTELRHIPVCLSSVILQPSLLTIAYNTWSAGSAEAVQISPNAMVTNSDNRSSVMLLLQRLPAVIRLSLAEQLNVVRIGNSVP